MGTHSSSQNAGSAEARPAAGAPVPTRVLFGYRFSALRLDQVVERCEAVVEAGESITLGVANAAKVVAMRRDSVLRNSVLGCQLLLADGQSIVWASRFLGRSLPERVPGIDVFARLLERADRGGRSVYLLGAQQEVLDELSRRIARDFPGLRLAGARNGYFGEADEAEVARGIREAGVDYLFVGMTSPKKEKFLGRWGASLDVRVCHGVGGSFDVFAGKTRRAPESWQRLGLEWAYRLVQEPRRLWRRYLVTNTLFLLLCLRERLHRVAPYELEPLAQGESTGGGPG